MEKESNLNWGENYGEKIIYNHKCKKWPDTIEGVSGLKSERKYRMKKIINEIEMLPWN